MERPSERGIEIEDKDIEDDTPGAPPNQKRNFLVAIGASAGGLEGLIGLFSHVPPDLDVPFVVVQHLSPTHRSMLAQLLGRETSMRVQDIEDQTVPEPNVVYITPANRNLLFHEGRLCLIEPGREVMPKPSVNAFFSSLAERKGEDVIGVILSGTGTDGANGIRAIKAAGGFTFAQDPSSAKYSGMPQAAIDTGSVDWVLPPDKIAVEIAALVRSRGTIRLHRKQEGTPTTLKSLLGRVRQRTKIDFSDYKETTVWRRIERRMAAGRVHSLDEYVALTEQQPEELDRLAKDILISVTAFFRDREAFAALRELIPQIVAGKSPGDEIRAWVPGCATGEEAYTLALLLAEHLGNRFADYKIQIFATDIDTDAMVVARKGMYPYSSLADIDPALVTKYFSPRGEVYEITKSLRESVLFARQDLIQDPPFLRLDLISCRNLLIYFKSELQARVLPIFHYALQPSGILFLGKSESILPQIDLFEVVNKDAKLFRKKNVTISLPVQGLGPLPAPLRERAGAPPKERGADEKMLAAVTALYVPATVLINGALDIQYSHGDIQRFLEFPAGRPSHSLLRSIRKEFRAEVQTLLHRARQKKTSAHGLPRLIPSIDEARAVRLVIHPVDDPGSEELFLACFEWIEPPAHPAPAEGSSDRDALTIKELQDELLTLREHLQTVVEELETSNEEMQALNEELQSSNEELQSTNEELETSNEELQSTNEELTTVNQELQVKAAELAAANTDLENIMTSADFPMIVVDDHLRVTRFNEAAARRFRFGPESLQRNVLDVTTEFSIPDLLPKIRAVIRDKKMNQEQISDGWRHYQLRISPYITQTRESRGAVLGFWDNTDLYVTTRNLRESQERLLAVMNNSTALVTVKDISGRYEFVNAQLERLFGLTSAQLLGKTDDQIMPQPISAAMRERELEVFLHKRPIETEEALTINGETRYFLTIRFPLLSDDGAIQSVCTKSTEITERKKTETRLAEMAALQEAILNGASYSIISTDESGTVRTFNTAAAQMLGYAPEEVCGKASVSTFYDPDELEREARASAEGPIPIFDALVRRARKGVADEREWTLVRKDKGRFPADVSVTALSGDGGRITGFLFVASDISERKQLDRVKREFISTVSHELRTPLTSIRGSLGLLAGGLAGELPQKARELIEVAKRNSERLTRLVNDILDIEKLESGGFEFALERQEIMPLIAQAVEASEGVAKEHGVRIVVAEPVASAKVNVDGDRLMQVLSNLLSNAAKFSPEGSEVHVSIRRAAGQIRVEVADRGRGIPDEFRDRLFEKFAQADSSDARQKGGTGLGLAISKAIVEKLNGKIGCSPNPGGGTIFHFELPEAG